MTLNDQNPYSPPQPSGGVAAKRKPIVLKKQSVFILGFFLGAIIPGLQLAMAFSSADDISNLPPSVYLMKPYLFLPDMILHGCIFGLAALGFQWIFNVVRSRFFRR